MDGSEGDKKHPLNFSFFCFFHELRACKRRADFETTCSRSSMAGSTMRCSSSSSGFGAMNACRIQELDCHLVIFPWHSWQIIFDATVHVSSSSYTNIPVESTPWVEWGAINFLLCMLSRLCFNEELEILLRTYGVTGVQMDHGDESTNVVDFPSFSWRRSACNRTDLAMVAWS